jgi:hypothetical protein
MDENTTAKGDEPKALQVAQGLEELARWLRDNPGFPVAWAFAAGDTIRGGGSAADIAEARDEFVRLGLEMAATASRHYGNLRMEREFAGGVTLHIDASQSLFGEPPPSAEPPLPSELRRFAAATLADEVDDFFASTEVDHAEGQR